MTTKKTNNGKGSAQPSGSSEPKRPYATLDLKATEVKTQASDAGKSGASSQAGKVSGASSTTLKGSGTLGEDSKAKTQGTKDVKASADRTSPKTGSKNGDGKKADTYKKAETNAKAPRKSGSGIGSMISHMAAGVVGGFLALVGGEAIAPQLAQLGITVPAARVDTSEAGAELSQRISALETANSTRTETNTNALEAQVNAAEAKLAELDAIVATVRALEQRQESLVMEVAAVEAAASSGGDIGTIGDRVSGLENKFATLETASGQGNGGTGITNLAAITGRLVDLETTLNNQMSALRSSVGSDIETRIGAISETSEAAKSGTVRMDRKVATLTTDTTRLAQRLEVMQADNDRLKETVRVAMENTAKATSALEDFKSKVNTTVTGLATHEDVGTAVSSVSARVNSLKKDVGTVVQAETDRKANAQRIVLSLELANLKRALERGTDYSAELANVRKASGGTLDLSKLEAFEKTGVPAAAALDASFPPVADAIIDAARAPNDGSVIDRLLAGAQSIVRVRKVNHDPDDTSVEAVVGRMETALEAGQLDQVVKVSQNLPDKAREPAQAWLAKVEARRSVGLALREIEGQLKSSLSGTGTAKEPATAPTQAN